jgi:glycosyltransferase involved in cell wall biosynthesis
MEQLKKLYRFSKPLQEVYQNAAIYYPQRNVAHLGQKMIKLHNDNDLKHKLSEKAIERSQYFSWEKCALETFNLLISSLKE